MAMTNQEVQKFISDYESLEKAKSMDINTFKSSLSEFGFSQATDNEAETLKNLIDLTVEKGATLSDEELDNAAGGLNKVQVGCIVGAVAGTLGVAGGFGLKTIYDKYIKDPKAKVTEAVDDYNKGLEGNKKIGIIDSETKALWPSNPKPRKDIKPLK